LTVVAAQIDSVGRRGGMLVAAARGTARGRFLLVEDDTMLVRALLRHMPAYGATTVAASAAEAAVALAAPTRWTALLVDIGLPDGSGLDVLAKARSTNLYLVKPVCTSLITSFLEQSLSASDRTAAVAARWSRRHDLSLAAKTSFSDQRSARPRTKSPRREEPRPSRSRNRPSASSRRRATAPSSWRRRLSSERAPASNAAHAAPDTPL
jgi:CheY-like chemotaxis protein